MGSSGSSSSSNSTTTENKDARQTAGDGAVQIGEGTELVINNDLSPEVVTIVEEAFTLARDAGRVAVDFALNDLEFKEKAINEVSQRASRAENTENLGQAILIKDAIPFVVVAIAIISITKQKRGS